MKYGGNNIPRITHQNDAFNSILAEKGNKNVLFLKFEDLVQKTETTLSKIEDLLGIDPFEQRDLTSPIFDQAGNKWKGNSSFASDSNPIGRFRSFLSPEVTDYIEWCCGPEMKYLGYDFESSSEKSRSDLTDFEPYEIERNIFPPNYSVSAENLSLEENRIKLLQSSSTSAESIVQNFIFPSVYEALKIHI